MIRLLMALVVALVGCSSNGDDAAACSSIADAATCRTTAGCQATVPQCAPGACHDVPAATCASVVTPPELTGASCTALDMAACKTRDDCELVHHIDTSAFECAAE